MFTADSNAVALSNLSPAWYGFFGRIRIRPGELKRAGYDPYPKRTPPNEAPIMTLGKRLFYQNTSRRYLPVKLRAWLSDAAGKGVELFSEPSFANEQWHEFSCLVWPAAKGESWVTMAIDADVELQCEFTHILNPSDPHKMFHGPVLHSASSLSFADLKLTIDAQQIR